MIINRSIIIILTGVFLSGCGMVKRGTIPQERNPEPASSLPVSASTSKMYVDDSDSHNEKEIKEFLDLAYNDWKGVPYLFGGSAYSGIDCSAFMQVVFEDYFSIILPRTTDEQLNVGRPISSSEKRAGDIIFFRTGAETLHVGVMVNHENFLHASTSSGVTISDMNNDFWQETYLSTRRILD